jgi:predicted nucleic acid-binding protein
MAAFARPRRRCERTLAARAERCRSLRLRPQGHQPGARPGIRRGFALLIFVDTSALYALLDQDDQFHEEARRVFTTLAADEAVTHNYVLIETIAIAQRRLGEVAARRLIQELVPAFTTVWIDEATHAAGVAALLAALPTRVSLIDFVSFEVMRDRGIARAFTFDVDFRKAGFEPMP